MNADLTISTLSFKTIYSDQSGSLRREVSRGINTPTELLIKHQDYVDSATKLPGKRHLTRFDYYVNASGNIVVPISIYSVAAVPTDVNITAAMVDSINQMLNNLLFAATGNTSGLNLNNAISVAGEQ